MVGIVSSVEMIETCFNVLHFVSLRELFKSLFEQLNVFRFNEGMVLGHLYIIQEDDRQE